MTTFITKFKISDDQTNIDKYRLAANITEYHIISKLILKRQLFHVKIFRLKEFFWFKSIHKQGNWTLKIKTDVRTEGRTDGLTNPNCRKTLQLKTGIFIYNLCRLIKARLIYIYGQSILTTSVYGHSSYRTSNLQQMFSLYCIQFPNNIRRIITYILKFS